MNLVDVTLTIILILGLIVALSKNANDINLKEKNK